MKAKHSFFIPTLSLIALVAVRVAFPQLAEDFQLKVFDTFQRLKPRPYREAPVLIVDIDEESLTKIGQWPWPRTKLAQLTGKLREEGASAIAFDIVFAEPDRTSPGQIIPLWSETPRFEAIRDQIKSLPDHDKVFASNLAKGNVVLGFSLTREPRPRRPLLKTTPAISGDSPLARLDRFRGAIPNLEAFEKAAAGVGSFNMLAESDGIMRRVPLLFRLEDALYPSLVNEALRVAQNASTYILKTAGGSGENSREDRDKIVSLLIGEFLVPTDAKGLLWLYDSGHVPRRFIPAWKIFSGDIPPGSLEGKIVFVGTSAVGLKDLRTTVLNPFAAGVEVQAQIAEQIILREFLHRPDWAEGAEILFLIVLGLILIFLMPQLSASGCVFLGIAAIGGAFGFSWFAFTSWHWLVDPVSPSILALFIYLTATLINYLRTESEKKHIRNAFNRYLSPELVEQLAGNPGQLKLGGETKIMTFLFADIRGFTTLSELFNAHELTSFINSFLTPMTDIILKHKGTIDKYMGDCVMAFWNAPLNDPEHSQNACLAALNMRDHLEQWNADLQIQSWTQKKPLPPIHIGIGINTGSCCVGNMGSEQRFDYSVLGDEVNLASRLEGQCKYYGVDIILGPNTAALGSDLAALELDLVQVKGKKIPVRIFTLLGDKAFYKDPSFQKIIPPHLEMLKTYREQKWEEAAKWLEECSQSELGRTKLSMLYSHYRDRIEKYRKTPPPAGWEGVFVAETK